MPTEQEWRDKYREVLGRLAAEEARWSKSQNVLKLLWDGCASPRRAATSGSTASWLA